MMSIHIYIYILHIHIMVQGLHHVLSLFVGVHIMVIAIYKRNCTPKIPQVSFSEHIVSQNITGIDRYRTPPYYIILDK